MKGNGRGTRGSDNKHDVDALKNSFHNDLICFLLLALRWYSASKGYSLFR